MGTSTTKKDPVRYAIMQQQSVLRYWHKHHGLSGRLSIGCLMFCSLVIHWCVAAVKSTLRPANREENRVKMRVSSARLRALFGAAPMPANVSQAASPQQGVAPPGG
jgi:hypothetical protein